MITKAEFLAVVDRMITKGGDWTVSYHGSGATLTYAGETHPISEQMAACMFDFAPRRATPTKED